MSDRRVLVVGTTSDYIDIIAHRFPGRALFLTDYRERRSAHEPAPAPGSEFLCDLAHPADIPDQVTDWLRKSAVTASGVVCYDCESMALASRIARKLELPYPTLASILLLRDKFRTKELWQREGVPCPKAAVITTEHEARDFHSALGAPVVLKPLTGSGSELTFRCENQAELSAAFRLIKDGLAKRASSRMYAKDDSDPGPDPHQSFAIEEFIEGPEFSCDFILDGDNATLIRVAAKVRGEGMPFGTTLAYELPGRLPDGLTEATLLEHLKHAARTAGLCRAICMVDFMVRDGIPVFIELTPRPGGDCLPFLIRRSSGVDTIGGALDFAEGRTLTVPTPENWRRLIGVRLFAPTAGKLEAVDFSDVRADRAVIECYLKRRPGHEIILPPADYDSWMLGHVIFAPTDAPLAPQCRVMASRVRLHIRDNDKKTDECNHGSRRDSAAADPAA